MAEPSKYDKLVSWAEVLIGTGFVLRGISNLRDPAQPRLGSNLGRAAPSQARGQIIEKAEVHDVRDINERVKYIQDMIRKDSLSPEIKEQALAILTKRCGGKWCTPEKDFVAEIKAIFAAVRDPSSPVAIRYTRDHPEVDQFTSARKLLKLHGGDCDDQSILLGALLRSVGYPVKLRVIQDTSSSTWSHIYPMCGIPPQNPTRWVPLDATVKGSRPGWEVPGATEALLSGRPSGLVTRTKDFEV